MSTNKMQEKWLNKKRFQFDWDSTDEDEYSQPSCRKILRKNSLNFVERSKTPTKVEAEDQQYLTDALDLSKKQLYRVHSTKHARTKATPLHNRNFWMIHDNTRTKGFSKFRFESKNDEEPYIDENSDLEDRMNMYLDRYRHIEFNNESLLRFEDYFDLKGPSTDFWKDETMEDTNYIRDAKPFLPDSDKDDLGLGQVSGKCYNGSYGERAFSFMPKIIR